MSVAFETGTNSDTNRIRQPGFAKGMWIYNSSETGRFTGDDRRSSKFAVDKEDDDQDSSSSSSIGNNSDASGGDGDSDDDGGGGEVQSLFKGSLNNLCALEQALPIKRGISTFYAGKSKSYTSLADAVSAPSIQDIVKPEDAYNRKRKNMIAHGVFMDKNRNFASKSGIPKRLNNNSNNNHNNNNTVGERETSSLSSSPNHSLPPLHSRPTRLPTNEFPDSSSPTRVYSSPWRSYSLSDLQQHAAGETETSKMKSSLGNVRDND